MPKVIYDKIVWDNRKEVYKCPETGEELPEETPRKEKHKMLVMGELDDPQYFFAWQYFKNARWVRAEYVQTISDEITDDEDVTRENDIYVYNVDVTYPSAVEQQEEAMYGFDYDE